MVFTAIWLIAGSADMGAWRMIEGTGAPPEQFNIGWKLGYLLGHPWHFVDVSLGTLAHAYDLWREMIGGLGWRDQIQVSVLSHRLARLGQWFRENF